MSWTKLDDSDAVRPAEPQRPVWFYSPIIRGFAGFSAVAFALLALFSYGLKMTPEGCRQPVCPGATLQCCVGGRCVARPDLLGLSCDAWRAADRPCDAYMCTYASSNATDGWLAAQEPFIEDTRLTRTMLMWGAGVSGLYALATVCVAPQVYIWAMDEFLRAEDRHAREMKFGAFRRPNI
jgi:hypothetical protein